MLHVTLQVLSTRDANNFSLDQIKTKIMVLLPVRMLSIFVPNLEIQHFLFSAYKCSAPQMLFESVSHPVSLIDIDIAILLLMLICSLYLYNPMFFNVLEKLLFGISMVTLSQFP